MKLKRKLPIIEKQTIIIHREGTFHTEMSNENQCKAVNWKDYKYEIKIEAPCKLDQQGFIIDQLIIDKAIKEHFRYFITSCEICCNEIQKIVYSLLELKEIKPIRTSVIVMPSVGEAYFELVTIYK